MNEYANTHKEFQLKVITTQEKLHNLLDEFDWEAFTIKINHEEGYSTYKHLVDGTGFHSAANVDWQRRRHLKIARKQAANTASDTKRSKTRQAFPKKFGFHQSGSPDNSSGRNTYDNPSKGPTAHGGASSGTNLKDGYKSRFNGHNPRD